MNCLDPRNHSTSQQQQYRDSRPCTPSSNPNDIKHAKMSTPTSPNKTIFSCHYCNGEFNSNSGLTNHLTYQCVKKQFSLSHGCCRDCGEHFKQYDEFLRHISRTGHINQNKKKSEHSSGLFSSDDSHRSSYSANSKIHQPIPINLRGSERSTPVINFNRSHQSGSPALFTPSNSSKTFQSVQPSSPRTASTTPIMFSNSSKSLQTAQPSSPRTSSTTPTMFSGPRDGDFSPVPIYDTNQQPLGRLQHMQQIHRPRAQVQVIEQATIPAQAAITFGSLYFAGEVKSDSLVAGAAWMILDACDGLIVQGSAPIAPSQMQISSSHIRAEYEALYQGLLAALQHHITVLTIKGTSDLINAHFFQGPRLPIFSALYHTVDDYSVRIAALLQQFRKVSYELVPASRSCFTQRIAGDAIHLFECRQKGNINNQSFASHDTLTDTRTDNNSMNISYPSFGYSSNGHASAFHLSECGSTTSGESGSMLASRATSSSNTPPRQCSPRKPTAECSDAGNLNLLAAGLPDWLIRSDGVLPLLSLSSRSNSHFM